MGSDGRPRAPSRGPGRREVANLLEWFDRHHRPLPWRRDRHPYHRWVAEVILQQTRVEQAVPLYERFVARFPDVRALARASEEEVLKAWEGAGYYARARRLRAAAATLVASGRVRWPASSSAWLELPGVGPYTARAIASQVLGEPVVALDANVGRVAARWTLELGPRGARGTGRRLQAYLETLRPDDRPGDFNEALMELGETLCRPALPKCPDCPVRSTCRAHRELADPSAVPGRAPRVRRPRVRASIAAVVRDGRWLVHRRPSSGLLGGLWELPGGKIEPGESAEDAVRREVFEETGLRLDDLARAGRVRHAYSHFSVELDVFRGRATGRLRPPGDGGSMRWVTPEEFERLARPTATVRAARLLGLTPPAGASRG